MACCDVVILEEAQREYLEIVAYLTNVLGSKQAASAFVQEFDKQVETIRLNPQCYAVSRMPELAAKGRRVALVNSYLFVYSFEGNTVFVEHIFHQSQDYARLV